MAPRLIKIYSENNDYQHIEVLRRNRTKRKRSKEFFVEGVMSINRAIDYEWSINAFVYSYDSDLSNWAMAILQTSTAIQHIELPTALMKKLSEKDEPSELLAVVAMPDDDLRRLEISATSVVVVLDRPASHGNLGTIIRTCDAFGVQGVIITGHAVDLYDPQTIRASRGSIFALPSVRVSTNEALIHWLTDLKNHLPDTQIIGTSAHAEVTLTDHNFNQPTVLFIGNETTGLRRGFQELCDTTVSIPMRGSATSLNVSNATSIILYEIERQLKNKPNLAR